MEEGMWLPHPLWGENKSEPGRTHMWQVARVTAGLEGLLWESRGLDWRVSQKTLESRSLGLEKWLRLPQTALEKKANCPEDPLHMVTRLSYISRQVD